MEEDVDRRDGTSPASPRRTLRAQESIETSFAQMIQSIRNLCTLLGALLGALVGSLVSIGVVVLFATFMLDARSVIILGGSMLFGSLVGAIVGRWILRRWW